MSQKDGILYAKQAGMYVLKLVGEIRFDRGAALDSFIQRMLAQQDCNKVLIDLTETRLVDSTALGLLAKIAIALDERQLEKARIITLNNDIDRILCSIGFDQVFVILHERSWPACELTELEPPPISADEMAAQVLDAHRTLSRLNPINQEMFRDVIETLEQDSSAL